MATLESTTQKLFPENYYHIFNRGINGQNIFFKEKNYSYFLKKYANYSKQYINTYAYCLLPNHFHFLIQPKSVDVILDAASKNHEKIPKILQKELLLKNLSFSEELNLSNIVDFSFVVKSENENIKENSASWIVSEQIRKMFLGYSKAINKQENRHGSLFEKPFKRKLIDNDAYFNWLVWYLHRNPIHHKITTNFQTYSHSSYRSFLSSKPSLLKRKEVLKNVGGLEQFINFHSKAAEDWEFWEKYIIE